jgi:hypothetical protein
MKVTREVILDLLPLYLAGEASPSTRELVEEYLKQDPELAQRIRLQMAEGLKRAAPSGLPPDLEFRSLKRTRRLLTLQKWLFGFGLAFAAFGLSIEFSTRNGHFREFHFLVRDYPTLFGGSLVCSVISWMLYFFVRHRIRTAGL